MANLEKSSLSHYGHYFGPTIEYGYVEWIIWAQE